MNKLQGFSFLSTSALKVASKATENAVKYGGIATQKVADISTHVSEKVRLIYFIFNSVLIFSVIDFDYLFFCFFVK